MYCFFHYANNNTNNDIDNNEIYQNIPVTQIKLLHSTNVLKNSLTDLGANKAEKTKKNKRLEALREN